MSKRMVTLNEKVPHHTFGELEFEYRDPKTKDVLHTWRQPNIIKIFAKECISHSLAFSKVWDPDANSGGGDWVDSCVDPMEEFNLKYILLGASFDDEGIPLETGDDRYYTEDPATGFTSPIRLDPGAHYEGELINAIPLAEPYRPLKKIERVYFEPTYQPASTPLLQDDVRAINNVLVVETTLKQDEYNGFGLTGSDFFTITEVALAGGKTVDSLTTCEISPRELFLDGPFEAEAAGGDVVSLASASDVNDIRQGDQIKITEPDVTGSGTFDQVTPYYLVLEKAGSGKDLVLDRTPVSQDGSPISGDVHVYRDTLRIFSHRVLSTPARKSDVFEIVIRWRIFIA